MSIKLGSQLPSIDDFRKTYEQSMKGKLSKSKAIKLWGAILKYSEDLLGPGGKSLKITLSRSEKLQDSKVLNDLITNFADCTGYKPTYDNWHWQLEIQ